MLRRFTIYGERCSGTNYLYELIINNFNVEHTNYYGWKHFFGFNNLANSDDTLFVAIVRDPVDWLNSLYREKHHLSPEIYKSIHSFLNHEFFSINGKGEEIMEDRNIYNGERYKNIFESRRTKNRFLIEDMPNKVKHLLLITYESLLDDFDNTMRKIKDKGLEVKSGIEFPVNVTYYKQEKDKPFVKNSKPILITRERVESRLDKKSESFLYPNRYGEQQKESTSYAEGGTAVLPQEQEQNRDDTKEKQETQNPSDCVAMGTPSTSSVTVLPDKSTTISILDPISRPILPGSTIGSTDGNDIIE